MNITASKICVIGAGIAGLSVARALALRGAKVTVLEQADAIREVGAGLQISPNGYVVLKALGLGRALAEQSVMADAVSLRDYQKGEVLRLDLTRQVPRHYHFVHRADLIETLAEGARAAGVKVRLLQKIESVTQGAPAQVTTASGATFEADLVIGADGLHSKMRPVLNETAKPFFTRQVAWRAVVPVEQKAERVARLFMAPHRHLVVYPLRDGKFLNVVAIQERAAWVEEGWNVKDDPDSLRAAFGDFGAEAQDVLRRIDEVHIWGLFRHPVAKTWVGKGMAMLGDAAHPTLPFLAQGANLALEDAWVLADTIEELGINPPALDAYQAKRRPRVCRAIKAANANAWKYHLSFGPIRWAAQMALRTGGRLAPQSMLQQFDWLYEHDVTRHS